MYRLLIIIAFLLPVAAGAQTIYKTVDEHGNVTYSDTAPSGERTETVELPQVNTSEPPPAIARPAPEPAADEPEGPQYDVSITAPGNETTVPMGPGNFSVSATVEPPLAGGNRLQLFMDGNAQGEPQSSGSWSLTNVFRGGHDLTVAVVDTEGARLAESAPIRVYVLRPSINYPNRQAPKPSPRPSPR